MDEESGGCRYPNIYNTKNKTFFVGSKSCRVTEALGTVSSHVK